MQSARPTAKPSASCAPNSSLLSRKATRPRLSALLTSGAELVPNDVEPVRGRDAIKKAFTEHFAKNPRVKIVLDVESPRFILRDTAIEGGQMTITPDKGEPSSNRYSILYVREDGKWLLALIKEWPSDRANLRDFDWLIGTWTAKARRCRGVHDLRVVWQQVVYPRQLLSPGKRQVFHWYADDRG